jgi:uncharacterized protein (DUF885 family)
VNNAREARRAEARRLWESTARAFVAEYLADRPSLATALGEHAHDGALESLAPERLAVMGGHAARFARELAAVPADGLAAAEAIDRVWAETRARAAEFEIAELAPWRWDPGWAVETAAEAVHQLVARQSRDPALRLQRTIARLRAVPALLDDARRHWSGVGGGGGSGGSGADLGAAAPTPVLRDLAARAAQDSLALFRRVVPAAFAGAGRAHDRDALAEACASAAAAMTRYAGALRALRDRPGAALGVGEAAYARRLALFECVTATPGEIDALARAEVRRIQERMNALARRVSRRPMAETLRALQRAHPAPEALLPEIRRLVDDLRRFCRAAKLVTLPRGPRCVVQEVPPFLRTTTIACMDVAGPFDPEPGDALYQVAPAEAAWSAEEQDQHLRFFNHAGNRWVTAHEAYPGHLVQLARLRDCASLVRKVLCPDTFVEGWAHYAEGIVFEAGYGEGEPAWLLSKEWGALMRAARCVVSVNLHCGGMTLEEAAAYYAHEAHATARLARQEVGRALTDFSCPAYTLGRLALEQLRADARAAAGARFDLKRFHDALLAEGQLPMDLLRQALLRPRRAGAA